MRPGGTTREQLGGEPLGRLMGVLGEDHLVQGLGGGTHGGDDARVPMAVSDHPPGRDGVDDTPAVGSKDIGPLRAHCLGEARPQRMLGERVPDGRVGIAPQGSLRDEPKRAAGLENDSGWNARANASASVCGVSGSRCGNRPRMATLPRDPMMRSFSGCASPTNATPSKGIARRRSASIDRSV